MFKVPSTKQAEGTVISPSISNPKHLYPSGLKISNLKGWSLCSQLTHVIPHVTLY